MLIVNSEYRKAHVSNLSRRAFWNMEKLFIIMASSQQKHSPLVEEIDQRNKHMKKPTPREFKKKNISCILIIVENKNIKL